MIKPYDRISAVNYARKWALDRNPLYYDFNNLGGDCTNFASQCVFSGANVMNYEPVYGWFYNHLQDRSPAWSGVDFFLKFLTTNNGNGPFGKEVYKSNIELGDVIFLGRNNLDFYHTMIVTKIDNSAVYVCCHTLDARDKPLYQYNFNQIKFVHIIGVRK